MMDRNERTVTCPACGGDGGFDDHRPNVPWQECRFCAGAGEVPTEPAGEMDMAAALEADGEKLRALTGEDHGPWEIVHVLADPDACDHEWAGWREFEGGGERVCAKCGMGAMHHSLMVGP